MKRVVEFQRRGYWFLFFSMLSLLEKDPLLNANDIGITKLRENAEVVLRFIKPLLPENPTILEAGAFNGNDTAKMAKMWRHSSIHAFEPVPQNYKILRKKCRRLKNVHTYQFALSDKRGTANFYVSELVSKPGISVGSGSLLEPQEHLEYDKNIVFPKSLIVATDTADQWAKQNNINKIDFMWLDMQGHELTMLRSAINILSTVKIIYTEVEFVKAYKDQPLYWDVKDWLNKQGFDVIALDFDESHAALGNKIAKDMRYFGNAVFINKNYRKTLSASV